MKTVKWWEEEEEAAEDVEPWVLKCCLACMQWFSRHCSPAFVPPPSLSLFAIAIHYTSAAANKTKTPLPSYKHSSFTKTQPTTLTACHFLAATPNMSPSNTVQIWFQMNAVSVVTFLNTWVAQYRKSGKCHQSNKILTVEKLARPLFRRQECKVWTLRWWGAAQSKIPFESASHTFKWTLPSSVNLGLSA